MSMPPTKPSQPTFESPSRPPISAAVRKGIAAPVFKPEFARSLRMHPMTAGAVALVVFVLIVAYALSLKPMYEAEALVYVEPAASKVLDDGTGGAFDSNKYDSYLQQQMQTAERLDILKAAVHALPVGVWRGREEPEQQAALRMQQSLKVERVLNSYQLSFTLKGPTAQGTADALNAIVAAFLDAGHKDALTTAGQRAQILTEEKNRISAELTTARTEQASLSSSLGMANPGLDADNPYDSQLAGLRTQLAEARAAHDMAAAQLASVSGSDPTRTLGLSAAADESIASDSGLSSMRATISQRRAVLSGQMAGLTPENPIYKQDQTEIAELDRTLNAMTTDMRDKAERRLQDKLRTDLARTGDVEARLNAQLASQTFAATSASPRLQRAAELTADIQRLMKRYATVDDSLRGLELESSGPGTAHLALAAAAPVYPVASRRKLLLLSALPLALLLGAFAAVFLRKRDPRVYSGRDVEDLLGFTPMAVLPALDGVSSGVMDEYMLRLAGGIESALRTGGARSFVLTPAGTNVAVESLSLPLAARLGHLGLDVASVTAAAMMAEPAGDRGTRRGGGPKAGQAGFVDARLDELMLEHDLVFVEAPTLLASAETEYLVRSADATILIATSGVTRRADLLQAALLLERLGVKGVGAVLEGLEPRFADASFRVALADVERRQSIESRAARVFAPVASAAPVVEAAPVHETLPVVHDIFASPAKIEAEHASISEPEAAEPEAETAPEQRPEVSADAHEGGSGVDEILEIPVAAPVSGEMMEPQTQEFATAATPESEPYLAPAQATEEPLPMAMQFLKFEQPEPAPQPEPYASAGAVPGAALRPDLQPDLQPAPPPVQTVHRRAPVRRMQPEPPPARNWFQKLFQRDAEPVVSIIPDNDDEQDEDDAEYAQAEPPPVYAAPAQRFNADDLDIPPRTQPVTEAIAPEMPVSLQPAAALQAEPVASAPAPLVDADADVWPVRHEAPLAWQQHPVETPELRPAPPARIEPVIAAAQTSRMPTHSAPPPAAEVREESLAEPVVAPVLALEPAPLQPIPAQEAWIATTPVPEPAALVSLPEPEPIQPIHSLPAAERAPVPVAIAEEIRQAPPIHVEPSPRTIRMEESQVQAPEPTPVAPEPFRTGRWEAARSVSRPETAPWRDRRVSGPNDIYRAPERRFNWNTAAAKPLSLVPNAAGQASTQRPSQAAGRPAPTGPERPAATAPESAGQPARLTRKWGLLSRFENPQDAPDTGREVERNAEPRTEPRTDQRSYRRG